MSVVQGLENLLLQYWRPATDMVERAADMSGGISWSAEVVRVDDGDPYVDLTGRDPETLSIVSSICLSYTDNHANAHVACSRNVTTIDIYVNGKSHNYTATDFYETAQEVVDNIPAYKL